MQHTYIMTYVRCALGIVTVESTSCAAADERNILRSCVSSAVLVNTASLHPKLRAFCRGLVIDATIKGGLARFINHSCDANCETQKWIVRGETRVGIFARRTIRPGQEITYDYHLEWNGFSRIRHVVRPADRYRTRGWQLAAARFMTDTVRASGFSLGLVVHRTSGICTQHTFAVGNLLSHSDTARQTESIFGNNMLEACITDVGQLVSVVRT